MVRNTYLQHARELGVSVRHEGLAPLGVVAQRADHVAERQQALVDVDALLQLLALRARALGPLAAGEIHEVKFTPSHLLVGGGPHHLGCAAVQGGLHNGAIVDGVLQNNRENGCTRQMHEKR